MRRRRVTLIAGASCFAFSQESLGAAGAFFNVIVGGDCRAETLAANVRCVTATAGVSEPFAGISWNRLSAACSPSNTVDDRQRYGRLSIMRLDVREFLGILRNILTAASFDGSVNWAYIFSQTEPNRGHSWSFRNVVG